MGILFDTNDGLFGVGEHLNLHRRGGKSHFHFIKAHSVFHFELSNTTLHSANGHKLTDSIWVDHYVLKDTVWQVLL